MMKKHLKVGLGFISAFMSLTMVIATVIMMVKNLVLLVNGKIDIYILLIFGICLISAAVFIVITEAIIPEYMKSDERKPKESSYSNNGLLSPPDE
jgi:uncharacterized membrane protein